MIIAGYLLEGVPSVRLFVWIVLGGIFAWRALVNIRFLSNHPDGHEHRPIFLQSFLVVVCLVGVIDCLYQFDTGVPLLTF